MKVSLNWIKKFTSVDLPIDELVEKIGAQLGAVEEVEDLGKKYKGIVVVKVVECDKHPNADKLHVCMIDDGKAVKNVKRDSRGLVRVVCGAPNVKEGLLVAWIPPGATVPSTVNKDPFVISAKELRGVISNGMLASAKELAIGDSHEGLLLIDRPAKPGEAFAEVYELDDYIIDIENKMFTHRPDCFGTLGIAREVAGIQHRPLKSPDWYAPDADLLNDGRKNVLDIKVKNDVPQLVPRFCAVAIKDIKIEPSPIWLQSFLARVGVRPINNIVDITNYLMLETAQPLHAYDYDKVKTGVLGVRLSKKGEEIKLLGGKTVKLGAGAVVITDGSKPIGMGGVMGGADTEVDNNTKNIILEVATFDMNLTRRTAMAYGLFTDAATRFTKGQSPLQNRAVLVKAADAIQNLAGGRIASKVVDDNHSKNTSPRPAVKTSAEFINVRLGLSLGAAEMAKLLKNVEFDVKTSDGDLRITPPFWRTDIGIPEDVVEEVGRLYGYDHLPQKLPSRNIAAAELTPSLEFKARLRQILSRAGANEVLTYSFVNDSLLQKAGQNPAEAYHIKNALSPDLQYYRLDLLPSLLEKVHPNVKNGYDHFALFEIGKSHVKDLLDEEKLPRQLERLAVVITTLKNPPDWGAPYFVARKILGYLSEELRVTGLQYRILSEEKKLSAEWKTAAQAFEPQHSAIVYSGDKIVGLLGEPTVRLRSGLKLPPRTAQLEFDLQILRELSLPEVEYKPLNRYPAIEQDLCLRGPVTLSYQELTDFVSQELKGTSAQQGYICELKPLDIFQKPTDKTHKQTTWRITLSHPERTLVTDEANKILDEIAAAANKKFKAERI